MQDNRHDQTDIDTNCLAKNIAFGQTKNVLQAAIAAKFDLIQIHTCLTSQLVRCSERFGLFEKISKISP